jgi:predicted molibdopterin-dependent oxidoreductase YjgC
MTIHLPIVGQSPARRSVELTVDGRPVRVPEGSTILDACRSVGIDTPTLCFAENLTPVNVCRVCVVELEGARTLVPSCSRTVEPGMVVRTESERVRHARKLVLELLGSSADLSRSPDFARFAARYDARPERFGPRATPHAEGEREHAHAGHHARPDGACAANVEQPAKVDNRLFVRDYERCILCYKCVEACGADAQNSFAIAVAGRGFEARISTEHDVPLDASACVFCGNCVGVCPTSALVFTTEFELREAGRWDESRQSETTTVCPYCGVGCALTLRVQDGAIVRITSPTESTVTAGHLCVKGRFGSRFVENR